MVLGFKSIFNGKPTGFPEKITNGIKIHTIRQDIHNRWKVGNTIQFATGVRTKQYNRFHRGQCKGIQKITMHYNSQIDDLNVRVDGRPLTSKEHRELALNDGFDSWLDFKAWWAPQALSTIEKHAQVLELKIIHWTDFKY